MWKTQSDAINEDTQHLSLNEPVLSEKDKENLQKIFDSKLQINSSDAMKNDKQISKKVNLQTTKSRRRKQRKLRLKRSLKMLYTAQRQQKKKFLVKQQQQKMKDEKREVLMDESSKESTMTAVSNDIDMSNLELICAASNQNKSAEQQFDELTQSFLSIYDMLLSKQSLKDEHLYSFINVTFKSLFKLATTKLFEPKMGRYKIKKFIKDKLFINFPKFNQMRKDYTSKQQIFDLKVQILIMLEFGCIHFCKQQIVDPIARFHHFSAYLGKLEIKCSSESYQKFMTHLIDNYLSKLPQTFCAYYKDKDLENDQVPRAILSILSNTNEQQQQQEQQQSNHHHNNNESDMVMKINDCMQTSVSTTVSISSSLSNISQTTDPVEDITSSEPQSNQSNRTNRKRKRSEFESDNVAPSPYKSKTKKSKENNLKSLQNVIITPSISAKTKPNQKLVSSSSRRTLARHRNSRGGALGSGHKRPIRAVITDQEDDKLNTSNQRKKRKLNNSAEIKITKTPSKPSLSKAATISVFSTNSNHNNTLTASVRKKRSTQWAEMDRIRKHRSMRRSKSNKRNKSKRTPPMLKNKKTESDSFEMSELSNDFAPPPMSRTQSMSALNTDNDECNEEKRGQSLPIETFSKCQTAAVSVVNPQSMSEDTSSSPIMTDVTDSRTMSFADDVNVGVFAPFNALQRMNHRQRMTFGYDDIVHDQVDHVQMKVADAMSGSWMDSNAESIIADHMNPHPFIHPQIMSNHRHFIKQSPTCSIRETPTFTNVAFGFGDQRLSGRFSLSEDISSGVLMNARNVIPETPDTCDGGNGASLIKSHCKENRRDRMLGSDASVATKKRLSFSCSQ